MIIKTTNDDISEKEFKKVLKAFLDDYNNYIYSDIMPEILTNSLKKAKLEAKQLNGFNENYFIVGMHFQ